MKIPLAVLLRIAVLLGLVIASYLWATGMMDSIFAYRSPLHDLPPGPGPSLAKIGSPALARRVVMVLIDALRDDTARDPNVMPTLTRLRQSGASATMHSRPASYSAPSYSVIFTGAWPDLSDGPALNVAYDEIKVWTQDNLFSAARRSGLKTGVSAFNWFQKLIPQDAVSASYYTAGEDQIADRQVVDAALAWLHEEQYALVFIHLDQVDFAGHYEGGPAAGSWNEAARRADALLEEISSQFDFDQDTLLVFSDHGQIDQGGHGGTERVVLTEPFVLAGAGVKPGVYEDIRMVDIAPTVAVLLSTNIPASSQGRPLTGMLDLPGTAVTVVEDAHRAQSRQLLLAYQSAIGTRVLSESAVDGATDYAELIETARLQRLNQERLLRLFPGMLALFLPGLWFWKRRLQELGEFLVAGFIYLGFFNLRYALLAKRTYSLSSVQGADDLILFCVSTSALALLAGWLLVYLRKGIYRLPAGTASLWTLDLVLAVIFLLFIPQVLSFVFNGAWVSWTLPDFQTMFLGFLSLIQILAVSGFGLMLALLTGLVASLRKWLPWAQIEC